MKVYFAPLEGITGYVYRNAFNRHFGNIDKYFAPFISTTQNHTLRNKEIRDILFENNKEIKLIPQLLSNKAEDFNVFAGLIKEYGYDEINLNLGCPARTVVSKKKGAGLLYETTMLDDMLYKIYEQNIVDISIKTRVGRYESLEFVKLLEIYNKYPIKELIIHPRIQKDYYGNKPDMEIFEYAMKNSKNPICYNGDIFTIDDYRLLIKKYNDLPAIMLGRGLLKNPLLIYDIVNDNNGSIDNIHNLNIIKEYHDEIYSTYRQMYYGEKNVLFKMKELWCYLNESFDAKQYGKYFKLIKKAEHLSEYDIAVKGYFTL